jgi:hypothetical protein
LALEQAACIIRSYDVSFISGLLQTEEYARAVIRLDRSLSDADVDRRVQLRMRRKQLLDKTDPPKLWAVIDEATLHRPYGGVGTQRAQLRHLAEVAELPNVTVQVMPVGAGGRPATTSPITILRFYEPELPDVVYVEQQTSGGLYPYRSAEMDHYWHVMNHRVTQAAQPWQTQELLRQILGEL